MKTKTIYVFHKEYPQVYQPKDEIPPGRKVGDKKYEDETRVFNTLPDAQDYACSFECTYSSVSSNTRSSTYFKYIQEVQITVKG